MIRIVEGVKGLGSNSGNSFPTYHLFERCSVLIVDIGLIPLQTDTDSFQRVLDKAIRFFSRVSRQDLSCSSRKYPLLDCIRIILVDISTDCILQSIFSQDFECLSLKVLAN